MYTCCTCLYLHTHLLLLLMYVVCIFSSVVCKFNMIWYDTWNIYSIAISLYCSYVANWITKITAEKIKPHNKTRQSRRRRRTQTSNCSKLFVQQPLVCSQQQLMLKVSFGQFVSSVSQNLTTQTKQSFCWSTGGQCSVVLLVVQLVSYTTYAYFLK